MQPIRSKTIKPQHETPSPPLLFHKFQAIRYSQNETLKISNDKKTYREFDAPFAEDVSAIAKLSKSFLHLISGNNVQLTDQQCEEIHYRGNLHRESNIVNENTKLHIDKVDETYKCQCGCKKARGTQISLCCPEKEFQCLGAGVTLFFLFQKGIVVSILLAALIFGVFVTYSNISQGNSPSLAHSCLDSKCSFIVNSSSQNNAQTSFANIQFILGISFCVIWAINLRVLKHLGIKIQAELDDNLNTSSDFSIKIDNLPFGEYNEEEIIEYFQSLQEKEILNAKKENQHNTQTFGIKSIQIIYNMQFCRTLIEKIKIECSAISELLELKDNHYFIDASDIQSYRTQKQAIIQTYQILSDLRKKFLTDANFRKKLATASCLVEFYQEKGKDFLLERYGNEKIGLLKQIQAMATNIFCPSTNNILFHGKILKLQRAPEPSDIIWLNCEKKKSVLRLVLIYLITFVMIMISFALLLGLQYLNIYFSAKEKNSQPSTISQVISLGTSISLQIVNKILWIVLYILLDLEYNDTLTNKIVSLMNKSLFATCVNILLLPIIVYVQFQDDLYGPNGLVGFVFNYHITVITAGLALKLFNPVALVIRVALAIMTFRNKILRFFRKQYGENEEQAFSRRIYSLYEGEYFDVAESYIFTITNVFHAVFYCHLLPPLLFFALAEIFLYIWINRVKILRFCKLPELTEILVFNTALSQAALVPIIYGGGSHFLGYFEHGRNQIYGLRAILQLTAIGVGVLSVFNPGNILNSLTCCILHIIGKDESNKIAEGSVKESEHELTNGEFIKGKDMNQDTIKRSEHLEPFTKTNRLENYYDNSNSLKLLGFEQVLKENESKQFGLELQYFCESFFLDDTVKFEEKDLIAKLVTHKIEANQRINEQ